MSMVTIQRGWSLCFEKGLRWHRSFLSGKDSSIPSGAFFLIQRSKSCYNHFSWMAKMCVFFILYFFYGILYCINLSLPYFSLISVMILLIFHFSCILSLNIWVILVLIQDFWCLFLLISASFSCVEILSYSCLCLIDTTFWVETWRDASALSVLIQTLFEISPQ